MIVPWIVSGLTAVWFGVLARLAGRAVALWAVGGALYSLCLSTMVLGLADAAFIPMSTAEELQHRIKWSLIAVGICVVVGLIVTARLYGEAAARLRQKPQATPESKPTASGSNPTAPPQA